MSPRLSLAAAKERYLRCRLEAFKGAATNLRDHIGFDFQVREWGGRAIEAANDTWIGRTVNWDWGEIIRRHHEPDKFAFTIWTGNDRLAAQGLALTTGIALNFRFFEGDPRADCPMKGKRILIGLEACAIYAQLLGKAELRVSPINSTLESLYQDIYGFKRVNPRAGEAYYVREV